MKTRYIQTGLLAICLLFLFACEKAQPLNAAPEKLVELTITSNSTVPLEYVINDKVIGTTPEGNMSTTMMVLTPDNKRDVGIRVKGSSNLIRTKTISSLPFRQTVSINYDGTNVYDKSVIVKVKGYSGAETLELVMDGQVLASGMEKQFPGNLAVNINEGQTRLLQIRKKGETTVLATKSITAAEGQSVMFYYDGSKIVDGIDLTPPSNPLNMNFSAKFESVLPLYYLGGMVDLVFFKRSSNGNNEETGLRVTLPADGSFSKNIELPPLPEETPGIPYIYSFRIFRSGTKDEVPYNTTADLLPLKFNFIPIVTYKAGSSRLWMLKDTRTSRATPAALKGTTYSILYTDIAEYFQ